MDDGPGAGRDTGPDAAVPSVEPAELLERVRAGEQVPLLDLRNRDEFEQWRVAGPGVEAAQAPYVEFVGAEATGSVAERFAETGLDEPAVAVCARGEASGYVAGLLRDAGVEAANLAGGMEAWARLTVASEVTAYDGPGALVQYERPSSGCLAYLLVSEGEAAVVDPLRAFADRYVADAEERGVALRYAVDTHVHADHVSGVRELAAEADATPVLPAGARDRGLQYEVETVADGDALRVGDASLTAVHAPGHTTELTAFRVGNVLLSADALFLDGVGRPDLQQGAGSDAGAAGGDEPRDAGDDAVRSLARRLHHTLHDRLLALPDDTVVAPGHVTPDAEPAPDGSLTARLGEVRDRLPLLDLDEDAFVDRVAGDASPRPANYAEIVAVNLGREDVGDAAAFELELGPNNCAVSGVAD